MGNVVVTLRHRHIGVGASVEVTADCTLASAYASGGDTLSLKSLGLDSCYTAQANLGPLGQPVRIVYGASDAADLKVMGFDQATGAELSGNQTACAFRVTARGNYTGA